MQRRKCKVAKTKDIALLRSWKGERMKQIQIPEQLFMELVKFHLLDMSFKCFSLAMSIISIKSFVEENRIIKKQNAILKKLQEVFGQVGILLKQ